VGQLCATQDPEEPIAIGVQGGFRSVDDPGPLLLPFAQLLQPVWALTHRKDQSGVLPAPSRLFERDEAHVEFHLSQRFGDAVQNDRVV